jgi:hypothetical protein
VCVWGKGGGGGFKATAPPAVGLGHAFIHPTLRASPTPELTHRTGPLNAVIAAQVAAAQATVDYITAIGFTEDSGEYTTKMVDFKYTTQDSNGTDVPKVLSVPLLALIPIPALEVLQPHARCTVPALSPSHTHTKSTQNHAQCALADANSIPSLPRCDLPVSDRLRSAPSSSTPRSRACPRRRPP